MSSPPAASAAREPRRAATMPPGTSASATASELAPTSRETAALLVPYSSSISGKSGETAKKLAPIE